MQRAIRVLNLIGSIASGGSAVAAVIRPAILSRSRNRESGEMFYARMYAARAIPLSVATGVLPFRTSGRTIASILYIAAAIQIVDVVLAVSNKDRGMAFGASVGAIVHIACGLTIN